MRNRPATLVVIEFGAADREPQLIERQVLTDAHGERQRHDFEEQRTLVPLSDLVEAEAVVGDDAGETRAFTGTARQNAALAQPLLLAMTLAAPRHARRGGIWWHSEGHG